MAQSGPLSRHVLRRIAAAQQPTTLTAAKAALREAGLPLKLAQDLLHEQELLVELRTHAEQDRLHRKVGYCPIEFQTFPTYRGGKRSVCGRGFTYVYKGTCSQAPKTGALLPDGTPQTRLQAARERAVSKAFYETLRSGVNDELEVKLTDIPSEIGLREVITTDWDTYRGRFKGWACQRRTLTLTAPTLWRQRVASRNLANVGGMLTLDASPMDGAPTGVELFAASWLRQGRGNAVHLDRGYIARSQSERAGQWVCFHGETAEQALAGLRRKVRGAQWAAALNAADLRSLARGREQLLVTVGDARAIGACDFGIRAWCWRVGIDFEAGSASLEAAVAAYEREPQPEARAAVLHALRRARALRLAA
jgi:hypothetical protein